MLLDELAQANIERDSGRLMLFGNFQKILRKGCKLIYTSDLAPWSAPGLS